MQRNEDEKYFLLINKVEPKKYKRFIYLIIFFIYCLSVFLIFFNNSDIRDQQSWASLVVFMGIIPTMLYFWRCDLSIIPLFALHGFYYSLNYGYSGLFRYGMSIRPSREIIITALMFTAAGLCSMYLGFYWFGEKLFRRTKSFNLDLHLNLGKLIVYAWFLEIFNLIYKFYLTNGGDNFVFFDQLAPLFGWFGKSVLFANVLMNLDKKKAGNNFFIFLILPFEFLLAFVSGALAQVFLLFIFLGLIFINYKKKIPVSLIIIVGLIYLILQPVKARYREITWYSNSTISITEKFGLFIKTILEGYSLDLGNDSYNDSRVERIDDIGLLAAVMEQTPDNVPFKYGITYAPLFTVWIPRFLWPEKPRETLGNEWAHWYGFINPSDTITSQNLPWLVEFYLNFGILGILIGMFLVGVMFKYLTRKLFNPRHSILEYSISLSFVFSIWYAQSNFSNMMGIVIIGAIAFYVFIKIIRQTV